ncbi:MAG: hypothetical protein NWF14_07140 [Candidatus Bathyarchaeota archaeon]|nr:hypothetical protein [Candidatus Bathyarchaeota archaeon]
MHDISVGSHNSRDDEVREEHISELKTIVYKTIVDPSTVRLICEKEKLKLFRRIGFLKPKPEEIQFNSLEKFYEPFVIVNGKYRIDYYRRRIHNLEIEDDVSELVVFNHVLKPKISSMDKIQRKGRTAELEAEHRIVKEKSVYLVLDRKGREVAVEDLPTAPAEERPEEILAETDDKVWRLEVAPESAIGTVRPKDAVRTASETFEVSEFTVVYTPVYQAACKNVKTGETRSLLISGVTSKIIEKTD